MYSYVFESGVGGKKAKGVKKRVVSKVIKHENYKEVLLGKTHMKHSMKSIRSNCHNVGTYEVVKKSLSCFDDKRFILDDGISSYAYGHCNAFDIVYK